MVGQVKKTERNGEESEQTFGSVATHAFRLHSENEMKNCDYSKILCFRENQLPYLFFKLAVFYCDIVKTSELMHF